jgi:hypothetical protein
VPTKALLLVPVLAGAIALGAAAAAPGDHALLALNILPPGEGQNLPELTSQIPLYDGLTPLRGNVTTSDLTRFYKPETLGLGGAKAVRVERPRAGVTIYRDAQDVPHVYGKTRADTEFGAGWVTAEDRGLTCSSCAARRAWPLSTSPATTRSPLRSRRARSCRARRPRHSWRNRRRSPRRRRMEGRC